MIRIVLAAGLIAVAACSQTGAATGSESASAPPASAAPTPAAPMLTPKGLGPLTIGMTDAAARAAVGAANIEGDTGTELSESCTEIKLKGDWPGIYLMIEDGKLSRISASDASPFKTDKGVGLGATPAQVMAAYPGAKSEPHKYQESPPAAYLTAWTVPDKEGTVFEVGDDGVVDSIHVGGPSIQYVEGCL